MVADAIAQALEMPIAERRSRHAELLAAVCEYDNDRWHSEFLMALRDDRTQDKLLTPDVAAVAFNRDSRRRAIVGSGLD